jgi:hypothetical protein
MKIEVDLNQLLCERDEEGNIVESAEDALLRYITEKLSGDLRKRLFQRMDEELSEFMRSQLQEVMKEKMPGLIDDIMNATYTPVTRYGEKKEPTTFRQELIKAITENMKYEPKSYSHDENAFTKAVRSILDAKTAAIQKAILEQVDTKFKEDAISFAVTKLSERLGLPKK